MMDLRLIMNCCVGGGTGNGNNTLVWLLRSMVWGFIMFVSLCAGGIMASD